MSNLRSEIIRIAFEHPETRPHLLPLVTAGCANLPNEAMVENCGAKKKVSDKTASGKWKVRQYQGNHSQAWLLTSEPNLHITIYGSNPHGWYVSVSYGDSGDGRMVTFVEVEAKTRDQAFLELLHGLRKVTVLNPALAKSLRSAGPPAI